LNVAADGLLTNVHIDNLKSKEGSQIVVNLNNPSANPSASQADIIVIDNTIHNDADTTTKIVFHDLSNNYINQVYLGSDDKIYFAQTQTSQTDYDFANTFSTTAVNDNYEIKIGYEINGSVYDWFLYRDPDFGPEDLALIDLPRAALEQTRSIMSPISKTNRDLCSCYQDECDHGFCRCENTGDMKRIWATPMYRRGTYDNPVETDFTLKGIDFGLDYQPTRYDMYGVFGSYRNGTYENDGKGKRYTTDFGSELDITSLIAGLYYRKYSGNLYTLVAAYGGSLDVDLKTDTNVSGTVNGYNIGAQAEIGYNARLTRREVLTPSLRATYNFIKFKDANDINGKKVSIDAVNNVELEAGLKYEYQFNNEYQLPTTGYIKPSVIQTISSGGTVKIDDNKYEDTIENETLGRIEIGADAEIIRNFSIGAFGNYTFGSEYKAWGVGGNIRYVW
ncbi:MAG: autotransporter outer membrane beta-barrel domain-containing protein, partial [Alphaproteobacteria bacterium]|nr:autotransporter outer membrane beta-barrel domain-containing protein [Alphaproteobacteria bacterium]